MVLATLSLSGVPIFSGFWSKDSVFLSALVAGTPLALTLLAVGVISAAMTFAYSIRYISNTFMHKESEFIHDLEHHGHHLHEAPTAMWAPIAVLVIMFCAVGVLGFAGLFNPELSPEVFIEGQLHHMVENIMPLEIAESIHVPHIDANTKLIGAALSAVALTIGGLLGYNFYWVKNWDSWKWVQASTLRQSIHKFLWNRWYMNDLYYKVFVDGILGLKQVIYDGFEAKVLVPLSDVVAKATYVVSEGFYKVLEEGVILGVINHGVPSFVIGVYNRVKKTQTGLLSMNLVYVVFMLLAIILGMIFFGGI
jgi:NADH-quinone oxidoreductase subunit L